MLICLVKKKSPNRCGPFGGDAVHLLAKCRSLLGKILNMTLAPLEHFLFEERKGGRGGVL